jgi:hypothetical protein
VEFLHSSITLLEYFAGGKVEMYACFFFSWGKKLDFSVIESLFITLGNFDELFCCCFSISVGFLFIYFWCVAESDFCPLPLILVIHVFCATLKLWSGGLLFCNRREECFFFSLLGASKSTKSNGLTNLTYENSGP